MCVLFNVKVKYFTFLLCYGSSFPSTGYHLLIFQNIIYLQHTSEIRTIVNSKSNSRYNMNPSSTRDCKRIYVVHDFFGQSVYTYSRNRIATNSNSQTQSAKHRPENVCVQTGLRPVRMVIFGLFVSVDALPLSV